MPTKQRNAKQSKAKQSGTRLADVLRLGCCGDPLRFCLQQRWKTRDTLVAAALIECTDRLQAPATNRCPPLRVIAYSTASTRRIFPSACMLASSHGPCKPGQGTFDAMHLAHRPLLLRNTSRPHQEHVGRSKPLHGAPRALLCNKFCFVAAAHRLWSSCGGKASDHQDRRLRRSSRTAKDRKIWRQSRQLPFPPLLAPTDAVDFLALHVPSLLRRFCAARCDATCCMSCMLRAARLQAMIAKAEADRQSSLVAGAAAPQVVASLDIMLVRGVCLPPAQLEYSRVSLAEL